jgi:hypothetical protein
MARLIPTEDNSNTEERQIYTYARRGMYLTVPVFERQQAAQALKSVANVIVVCMLIPRHYFI